uniref:Proteasome 20S subunit alpha 5 n=1 Tax=Meleagris gallopavo TaxID=9103 RepID=A0A803Y7P5_MELGA
MVFTFPSATSALLGSTAIGIQTSEGVCLAVEKRITSPLMEPSSIEKIVEIDSHIGCAMSGLIADAKTLIDKARVETQNHWFTYNETMTVESVTQAVSNLALQFGEEDADPGAMSRPFGVALLFGGVDEKGPQLFHMDPSGTFVQCDARAIGSASEGAQSSLQEVYHKSMTLKEAIKSSLVILKQVMEEKLNATNIEAFYEAQEPEMRFGTANLQSSFEDFAVPSSRRTEHCPATGACHRGARHEVPHVHERGAGRGHQGYLKGDRDSLKGSFPRSKRTDSQFLPVPVILFPAASVIALLRRLLWFFYSLCT